MINNGNNFRSGIPLVVSVVEIPFVVWVAGPMPALSLSAVWEFESPMEASNGSGIPAPSCGTGVTWTENILVPDSCWGEGCGYESWASVTGSRPRFGGRSDDEQWE